MHHSNHHTMLLSMDVRHISTDDRRYEYIHYTYLLFSFALQEHIYIAPLLQHPQRLFGTGLENKTLHTFPAVWRLHSICGTSEILAAVVVNDIINLMNRLHFFIRMSISTALQYGQAEKNIPTIRQTYIICMHAWTYSCWGPDVDVTQQHPQHPETPKLFWVALFLK